MTAVKIELPKKLIPVFCGPADVRGAYGGRGSAKTRSFAKMTAVHGYRCAEAGREGIILCARQFQNSLDESSLEEIKSAIQSEDWLRDYYEIGEKYVRTKNGRVAYKFTGLDRNVDSVKSKARILLCWVDEAEPVTDAAWTKLIPTLREEDSELWVTWNPERKTSATHKRFRETEDPRYKVVEINWRDNPRFPDKLERDRQRDQRDRPDQYAHIWEGDFKAIYEGAYFAAALTTAKTEGRIGHVAADPLIQKKAAWDIGTSDSTAIWIAQWVGREIRWLDYIEAQGQGLAYYVNELRSRGHEDAFCILPHDGAHRDHFTAVKYEDHLRAAGFKVKTVSNQGDGAAMLRIEAMRRLFPRMWFNQDTCQPGIDALAAYHEKRDEKRNIGLGPAHDWASHCADAAGLMAVAYEEPVIRTKPREVMPRGSHGWMG